MINKDLSESFNRVADHYNCARLGYPPELYDEISFHTKLDSNSIILEIGCGSGIATMEISNRWNSYIKAIDPGKNLLELAKLLNNNKKIEFIETNYESFESTELFDAIFSATSFHWIDEKVKYIKSYTLLKENGYIVLFWNNYSIADDDAYNDIQKIYKESHPLKNNEDLRVVQNKKIESRKKDLENSKLFSSVLHKEYFNTVLMDSEKYISLLKSFSDNSSMPQEYLVDFYNKIKKYIKEKNNEIKIQVRVNLEIGLKTKEG